MKRDRIMKKQIVLLGLRYRKTGVVFFGLEKPGAPRQTDFFDTTPTTERSQLYKAVDALNARLGTRSWHMKRQKLSRRPTTRWDELMTAK